jgi:hypothetical protein
MLAEPGRATYASFRADMFPVRTFSCDLADGPLLVSPVRLLRRDWHVLNRTAPTPHKISSPNTYCIATQSRRPIHLCWASSCQVQSVGKNLGLPGGHRNLPPFRTAINITLGFNPALHASFSAFFLCPTLDVALQRSA